MLGGMPPPAIPILRGAVPLSLAVATSACALLVTAPPVGDGGAAVGQAPSADAGALHDGGTSYDAGAVTDSGPLDAGLSQDAGGVVGPDAGFPDAGLGDAGVVDPGANDDGGAVPDDDAGAAEDAGVREVDAGPVYFRVLASGSATGSASVPLDLGALQDSDTVLLFLAREEVAAVDVPGDWSGPTFARQDSDGQEVVGATRVFQEEPASLSNPLPIGVESGERFSYALVGVLDLAGPDDSDSHRGDTTSTAACAGVTTTSHDLSAEDPFYAVTALAHVGAPALGIAPGRALERVEPPLGPSLLLQVLESGAQNAVSSRACLDREGPYVSLAHSFERP